MKGRTHDQQQRVTLSPAEYEQLLQQRDLYLADREAARATLRALADAVQVAAPLVSRLAVTTKQQQQDLAALAAAVATARMVLAPPASDAMKGGA